MTTLIAHYLQFIIKLEILIGFDYVKFISLHISKGVSRPFLSPPLPKITQMGQDKREQKGTKRDKKVPKIRNNLDKRGQKETKGDKMGHKSTKS